MSAMDSILLTFTLLAAFCLSQCVRLRILDPSSDDPRPVQVLDVNGVCEEDQQCPEGYVCRYINSLPGTKACVSRRMSSDAGSNSPNKKSVGRCPNIAPNVKYSQRYQQRPPPPPEKPIPPPRRPPPPEKRRPPPPPGPPGTRPCNDHLDCPGEKRCCPKTFGGVSSCVDPKPIDGRPTVTPLIVGVQNYSLYPIQIHCSATLVQSNGYNILIDPAVHRIVVLQTLFEQTGLLLQDVHMVVETHGHPDHYASSHLFSSVDHVYNTVTYNGKTFTVNALGRKEKYFPNNDANVEIIQTPGHTPQDVSVVVRNVPNLGTLTIVGDLITQKDEEYDRYAWNRTMSDENRQKVVCSSDYILPGHSPMFRVDAEQKLKYKCTN